MKITVWTLTSDTDNGTDTQVYSSEHEARSAQFSAIFYNEELREMPRGKAAAAALTARDYPTFADECWKHLDETSVDYFGVQVHTVDVDIFYCRGCGREESECSLNPCPGVIADRQENIAQCVSEDELKDERAALSPEDRAQLDKLPSVPELFTDLFKKHFTLADERTRAGNHVPSDEETCADCEGTREQCTCEKFAI